MREEVWGGVRKCGEGQGVPQGAAQLTDETMDVLINEYAGVREQGVERYIAGEAGVSLYLEVCVHDLKASL